MAKITDSQGKQWGLMASKDAMGRIYVRAYQNKWDVQKSRSAREHENGTVFL